MAPFLCPGDELVFELCSQFQIGDIVVYKDQWSKLVAHRILKLNPLIIKGDRTLEFEADQNPIGKVIEIRRKNKTLTLVHHNYIGKIFAYFSRNNHAGNPIRKLWILAMIIFDKVIFWSCAKNN